MSNYPFSLDNSITLPGVVGSTQEDVAITALRSAVFAIETELGVTPSGVYPDVRTRLDILEARIQFGISPNIPNDGYVKSPLYIWNVPASTILSISDGYGAPTENRLDGSIYMRGGDGYANNQLYVRLSNHWYPVQTEQFTATHDLAPFLSVPGNSDGHLAQTVVGLYNHPFNPTMNTVGITQDGYHITWNNSLAEWEPQTGFIPTHDLTAFSGPYGRTGQTVTGLQGFHVSPVTPTDGYALVWSANDAAWEPRVKEIIFSNSVVAGDGYIVRTNLISNKIFQSPNISAAGKVGMVNFGSRSSGATTGVTDNYGAILSGDRLSVSGSYGVAVGGDSNIVSGQYGTVVGGLTNTASAQYAAVLNGTNNIASQTQTVVMDGYSNLASAQNSFVLNGGNNQAKANFSGVLNGISNVITLGATHAGIGWGFSNSINANGISSVILGGNNNQANAQNIFVGVPTGAIISSNNSAVLTGITNTINSTSDHSVILAGNVNTVSAASGFGFIGTGNALTVTGLYATILNSTIGTANGLHALILNGNTNTVNASFSSVVNGRNNLINIVGTDAHGTIVDGYSNTITGQGSFIGDGYSNSISGQFTSILNGNNNGSVTPIAASNSTILNGSFNLMDSASSFSAILFGTANTLASTSRVVVAGNGNIFTGVTNAYVLGQFNNVQGSSTKITGDSNVIGTGSNFNRIFGNNNNLGVNSVQNSIFGANNNLINSTHDNIILGSTNIVDGAGSSTILGMSNIANSNFGFVQGMFGKSRLYGQQVHASGRFTPGKIGEVQWSRIIIDGYSTSFGAAIPLQLQDTTLPLPTNPTFVDGYSYDMEVRVLIVNTSPIGPNPVVPARYVIDVLAHQEGGVLFLDNINFTLATPNTSDSPTRTPWTVTISATANQLLVTVDAEAITSYVQPGNTPSNRRAVASVDMREISRL